MTTTIIIPGFKPTPEGAILSTEVFGYKPEDSAVLEDRHAKILAYLMDGGWLLCRAGTSQYAATLFKAGERVLLHTARDGKFRALCIKPVV